MSESNNYVNLSFSQKDKREQLKASVTDFLERHKNFNRINAVVSVECSKLCLNNLKSDKLNSDEIMCLSSCATKFYDAIELGDHVFSLLSSRKVDLTPLSKGRFEDVINKV
jgi:hypothetical protein